MAHRLEPAHLPFPLPSESMRDFGSIVQTLSLLVDDTRQELFASCTIAPQPIRHDLARHIAQTRSGLSLSETTSASAGSHLH